jgi:WhiB family transcriptional regulator, redox-sensing transcriptional regulator
MNLQGLRETEQFAKAWRRAEASGHALPCTTGGDYWTSDSQADRAYAVELCKPCPIRAQCLNAALARDECFSVWGLDLTDARSGAHIRKRKAAA